MRVDYILLFLFSVWVDFFQIVKSDKPIGCEIDSEAKICYH